MEQKNLWDIEVGVMVSAEYPLDNEFGKRVLKTPFKVVERLEQEEGLPLYVLEDTETGEVWDACPPTQYNSRFLLIDYGLVCC
ncbi:hypothetical protein [Niallia taxi]|uniref:hypothetical protein n=1 Tax=Niallia taxi TaxID=2499688 RepID=UPI0015F4CA2F|nr:hypothetical protein [Niallia taxi]